ncbi:hypothetical protein FQN54_009872 [Arachnomyces sp. PD_36]|nr:hypothetical protein FQN54_009872 [Arachnomyces sp. PD_36]
MPSNVQPETEGKLCDIVANGETSSGQSDVAVIIVPDIKERDASTSAAIGIINSILPNPSFKKFKHKVLPDTGENIWESLIDCPAEELLLEVLEVKQRRIFFIGFGIGGLVLKEFLISVHGNYGNPEVGPLREAISGVILSDVPHPTSLFEERWPQVISMLRPQIRLRRWQWAEAKERLPAVANLSSEFEAASISTNIISVCTLNTRKGWLRLKPAVDEGLFVTGLRNEVVENASWESPRGTQQIKERFLKIF